MNILLTGFGPFDKEAINPSWEAVRTLDGWRCEGAQVHARRISCVFGAALRELDAAIDELQPVLAIGVGQAGEHHHRPATGAAHARFHFRLAGQSVE